MGRGYVLFVLLVAGACCFALGYWWREQKENDARPAGDIQRHYESSGNSGQQSGVWRG